ncbi:restriction endonuclease subunit S [Micromonospora sp. DT48]
MNKWQKIRLSDCCEIVSGATPKTGVGEYWDGNISWATPKDLSDLHGAAFIHDTPRKITEAGLKSCAASVLPPGSVLLSSRAPIGHVAINTVPMATNQGFKSLVPDAAILEPKYLYWWLKTNSAYLESLGNGATFKEISKAVVSRVEVPVPPLPEQRRIAEVLDRADDLRAKRRESLAHLDDLTQSIFRDMFGDPVENPKNFEVRPLIEWIDPGRPITYGILKPGEGTSDGPKYVRVVDMKNGRIDPTNIRRTTQTISDQYRRSLLRGGDLLMSIRGHVGRLAVVPESLNGANITQDSARLAVDLRSAYYVMECIRTPALQNWMARRTKGAAVQGINLADVKNIPIPAPPLAEQLEFRDRATSIGALKAAHSKSLAELDELFASLQDRAFQGGLCS